MGRLEGTTGSGFTVTDRRTPRGIDHRYDLIRRGPTLSPDLLWADNRAPATQGNIAQWMEKLQNGEVVAIDTCADSRTAGLYDESRALIRSSIATGGRREPIQLPAITLTHYNGVRSEEVEQLVGCGGGDARAALELSPATPGLDELADFLLRQLASASPVDQARHVAQERSRTSPDPSLAGVIDHMTGLISPVAVYQDGRTIMSNLNGHDVRKMSPSDLAEVAIPINQLPDPLAAYLTAHNAHLTRLHEKLPLTTMQEAQNPPVLLLSTTDVPSSVAFPDSFSIPGGVFRLHIPSTSGRISISDFVTVLQQMKYPFAHFDIDTVVIRTPDMDSSRQLATVVDSYRKTSQWRRYPNDQLIITASNAGSLTDIDIVHLP